MTDDRLLRILALGCILFVVASAKVPDNLAFTAIGAIAAVAGVTPMIRNRRQGAQGE